MCELRQISIVMASGGISSSIAAARLLVIHDARLLYRRLLRAHRLLPAPMRQLGDAHIRHEWREALRRGNASADDTARFLAAWREYASALESGELGSMRDDLHHLTDEQKQRMEEMRQAATGNMDSASPPRDTSPASTSDRFQ